MLVAGAMAAASLAVVSGPAAAGGVTLSARAKGTIGNGYRAVRYRGRKGEIVGALSTGAKGVPLVLQAKRFPFHKPFHTVGRVRTEAAGHYAFKVSPTLGTRYRVLLGPDRSVRSRVVTMYVINSFTVKRITAGPGCHHRAPTTCVDHFTFDVYFPPSVAAREVAGRWDSYFGVNVVQDPAKAKLPRTLRLDPSAPIHWSQVSGGTYLMKVAPRYTVGPAYRTKGWNARSYYDSCPPNEYASDGFGLPGNPYHCGAATIRRPDAVSRAEVLRSPGPEMVLAALGSGG